MSADDAVTVGDVVLPRPAGWHDLTVPTVVGPEIDGAQPNVVITREALCANLGLGGFSVGWLQKLADQVPVRESQPVEHIAVSGHPGHLRRVEWEAAGLRLRQLVALTAVDGHGYAIVCTVPSSAYEALEPELLALIGGVRLGPGVAPEAVAS